ncbi:MAG: hypothetical protein AAF846_20635 [Chloroflexota bacterium]
MSKRKPKIKVDVLAQFLHDDEDVLWHKYTPQSLEMHQFYRLRADQPIELTRQGDWFESVILMVLGLLIALSGVGIFGFEFGNWIPNLLFGMIPVILVITIIQAIRRRLSKQHHLADGTLYALTT